MMSCCRKAMSWMVSYLSGFGRLMSLKYRISFSLDLGRSTRPDTVDTGCPQICVSFCTAFCALVCAEQCTMATSVDGRRLSRCWRRVDLPLPSGPTSRNGSLLSSHGCSSATFCCTLPVITRSTLSPVAGATGSCPNTGGISSRLPSLVMRVISWRNSSRASVSRLAPRPRARPQQKSRCVVAALRCEMAEYTHPIFVVSTAAPRAMHQSSARWK
mmetsp:Transcript_17017/g.54259  ORF Transcript_17017/g.54259 Transcript_17017/m.54259 type:complete len:215 (-) Transcript_17017:6755-7399(-)